jgi:hypothetical protein
MLKLLAATTLLGAVYTQNSSLPEVDLGYEIHQAASFNVSILQLYIQTTNIWQRAGNFYNFTNVRYAAPPIGDLRFAHPQAPDENRSSVNNGGTPRYARTASTLFA